VALLTFFVSLILSKPIARAARRAADQKIGNAETARLLSRIAKWSVVVLGTILALDQVDFDITGFVAGLGVAGITIGFALQDIARNFVAGLLLFARQPFRIGDAVKIAGFTGKVKDITTRDTVIQTWDGEDVIIANIDVLGNAIVNYSNLPRRRRTVMVGLGYGQDADDAMAVFQSAVQAVPGVLEEPAPTVFAEALGDSTMNLAARFWVDTAGHNLLRVHSDVVVALTEAAERAGIDLPYPIQTVRLESAPSVEPEALGERQ
jgi:small-conductance mechanosensitive channel